MPPQPRSSVSSNPFTKASSVAASGRGLPAGGIMLPRTFLITFSHTSALRGTSEPSTESSASPPVLRRALWQVTQYWLTSAGEAAARTLGALGICPNLDERDGRPGP